MFTYTTFGTTDLPVYNPEFGVGVMASVDVILETAGGPYDAGGDDQLDVMRTVVTHKGTVLGSSAADLKTQIRALRKLRGTKAKLYREWDDGDEEWVYARCVAVEGTRGAGYALHQELTFTFAVLSPVWYGVNRSGYGFLSSSPDSFMFTNSGDAVSNNFKLTVQAGSAAITSITLEMGDAEIQYTGTIAASKQLVIDCAALSVLNDGNNAYDDFELTSNHIERGWLPLQPGSNTLNVTWTGGGSGSLIVYTYHDAWY